MLFAFICTDKPGRHDLRAATRPDHLAYLNALGDKLKFAGPFLDENGNGIGSMGVVEAADKAEAVQIAADDPYAKAGLFAATDIRAWRWAIKNLEAK